MKAYVIAFCSVLLAAPALAQPSSPTGGSSEPSNASSAPQTPGSGERAHEERQICRRIDSGTSRRIGSRLVCHTAAEWRSLQDDS
jgi:hypothetical protein